MLHAYVLAFPRIARRSCSARQIFDSDAMNTNLHKDSRPKLNPLSPLYDCWSIAKRLQPRTPPQVTQPPQVVALAKQCNVRVGHLTREPNSSAVKKNSCKLYTFAVEFPCNFPQSSLILWIRFRCGNNRTHLPDSYWVGKHQNAMKSRTGFLRLRLLLPPASKPISAFRNVTWSRVQRTRASHVWLRLWSWPLYCLVYIIGKYNSDRDMLDQSSTSLDTITLSNSPRGWEPRAS